MSRRGRQNRYARRLRSKIKRFERRGWDCKGLKQELDYCTGARERQTFATGAQAWEVYRTKLRTKPPSEMQALLTKLRTSLSTKTQRF